MLLSLVVSFTTSWMGLAATEPPPEIRLPESSRDDDEGEVDEDTPPRRSGAPRRDGPDETKSDARARRPPPPPPAAPPADTAASVPVIDQRTPTTNLENAWSYSRSEAPRPAYVNDSTRALLQINPIGYYQGVTPGGDNPPPFAAESFGVTPAILTWTGFQRVSGGGSEVFVQLSTNVQYELATTPDRVVVKLAHTTVNVKNNQRRLDTRFFITPVEFVDVRPTSVGTDLVIELRRPAQPTITQTPAPGGYTMFVIGFGNDAAAAPTSGTTPPETQSIPAPPSPPKSK